MSPLKQSTNIAARMGRWSSKHRKTAIFGWLAFVVASVVIGGAVGMKTIDPNDMNVGEARTADHIVRDAGFKLDQQMEYVLVQSSTTTATDPAFRAVVDQAIAKLDSFPKVTELRSPFAKGNDGQISADGHAVLIQFSPKGGYDEAAKYIDTITAGTEQVQKANPDFTVVEAGSASTGKALDEMFGSQLARAGMISIPITLVILMLVFGSLVGALIPLGLALTAVFATMGLVALPSHIVPMDESISEVILLIGLAVGVDYSLFYIRRERDERRAGRSESAALEAAAATSGRAVLISGITVMIAMAGMFFSGDKTFMSFAIGTMMVVLVAMIGSLTVLPAMLSWLGDRIDKVQIPFVKRLKRDDGQGRLWGAILGAVLRRPLVSAIGATAVLVALALPADQPPHEPVGPRGDAEVAEGGPGLQEGAGRLPGWRNAGDRRDRGQHGRSRAPGGGHGPEAAGARLRQGARADLLGGLAERQGAPGLRPARRERHRRDLERGARHPAERGPARHDRQGRRHRVRRDGSDGGVEGLEREHEVLCTARVRLRPQLRVRAAARLVPLDRDPDQGDPDEPAVGRGRVRRCSSRCSSGAGGRTSSTSRRTVASRHGCRCSCS